MKVFKIQIDVLLAEDRRRPFVQKWVTGFRLNGRQAQELRRLKSGLFAGGAVLESGRSVTSSAQVFLWLLEEIARARAGEMEQGTVIVEGASLPGTEQLTPRLVK